MHGTIKKIKVEEIKIVYNPREDFNREQLTQLAISINKMGLLTPLDVKPDGAEYVLMDGERRYRAITQMQKLLKKERLSKNSIVLSENIPCYVHSVQLSESNALLAQILKNTGLKLWPWEQGAGFQKLVELGMSVMDIANAMGKSLSYIYERINFVSATQLLKDSVMNKELNIYEAMKTNQEIIRAEKKIEIEEEAPPTEGKKDKIAEETIKDNILEKRIKKRVKEAAVTEGVSRKRNKVGLTGTVKDKVAKRARRDGIEIALRVLKRLMGVVVFDIPKDKDSKGTETKSVFNSKIADILKKLEDIEEIFAKSGNE